MGIKEILLAFVIYYPHLSTKSLKWQSVTTATATTTNHPFFHPAIELLSPVVSLVGPSPDLVFMIWTTHFSKNLCQMFAIRYAFHAWIFISFRSHSIRSNTIQFGNLLYPVPIMAIIFGREKISPQFEKIHFTRRLIYKMFLTCVKTKINWLQSPSMLSWAAVIFSFSPFFLLLVSVRKFQVATPPDFVLESIKIG